MKFSSERAKFQNLYSNMHIPKPMNRGEDGLEKGLQGQGLDLKNHMTDCHSKKVFKSFFGLFPWFSTLSKKPRDSHMRNHSSKASPQHFKILCIKCSEDYRNSEYPLHSCPQKSSNCLSACTEAWPACLQIHIVQVKSKYSCKKPHPPIIKWSLLAIL